MCQGLPPPTPLEEEVLPEDKLEVAGSVLSVIEGMIVVQGPENSRALKEG